MALALEKGEPPCGSQGGSPNSLGNNHIQKKHFAPTKTTHSRAAPQYSLGQSSLCFSVFLCSSFLFFFFLTFFYCPLFFFLFLFLFSGAENDPIPSPEERLIWSQSSFVFNFVLGPGTDSKNCAGVRSYIIRCSLCARNSRTLGSQLYSDTLDLFVIPRLSGKR